MTPISSKPAFSPQKINMDPYQSKVENFVVILDASESMAAGYDGSTRFEAAKTIISRMNQTLPSLDLKGGLRTFGNSWSVSKGNTALMYGMTSYTKAGLQAGLDKVMNAYGFSPLGSAIDAVNEDLRGTSGNTAVIIASDGDAMGNAPVEAAIRLKKQYGSQVCIYTIAVGSKPAGKEYLRKLSQIGECGYAAEAEKITTSAGMAGFVQDVFLIKRMDDDHDGVYNDQDKCPGTPPGVAVDMKGCPVDSDGDGVPNYLDKCPGTPQGVDVDMKGCPVDSDGDGVPDYLDKCPGTPQGVDVDMKGCPVDSDGDGVPNYLDKCPDTPRGKPVDVKGCPIPYEDIKFDTSSANIKSVSYPVLSEIAGVLNRNPNLKFEVQGHTDSSGSLAFNNKLSADRAKAVREHLIGQGVNPDQVTSAGYGPSKPLVSNNTPEGRARNRRVELKPLQ